MNVNRLVKELRDSKSRSNIRLSEVPGKILVKIYF